MNSEQRYILALSFIKGIGDNRIFFLVNFFGSAKAVWESSKNELLNISGFGPKLIKDIGNEKYLDLADAEIEFCKFNNISIITLFDDSYPSLLKQCPDAPIVLFTKGNILFENTKKIAIVGTRKMTNYGKLFIEELIDGIKDYDVTIVSGLAYGCDIYSHIQALKFNIPTWAVLAHHLNHIYPPQHKNVALEMLETGGWISEQSSIKGVSPKYFLQRNRIIAGLSDVTIMVESGSHGGSLVTAKFANDYNRDVFALPGKSTDILSSGCNYMIKTHQAYLIESSKDLAYHLNLNDNPKKTNQLEMFVELTVEEQKIVDFLDQNGKTHIDALSISLDLLTYELMPVLLDLELKNILQPLPGKYFELSR
ncbi:DNA-processing protein DprA [Faecalibacter macacae]|uniref:DNA-protecting protein DprA n=1 Tax=Faecalibacter macacae TaxID=1859289 RepID=A0A3L9MBJ7_9FLAO|nr:DNA-processing protein DprA [Faecalibacter macacae]RLZ10435.1 DNA-protecting protein DprA [Faecalibacter macacae]